MRDMRLRFNAEVGPLFQRHIRYSPSHRKAAYFKKTKIPQKRMRNDFFAVKSKLLDTDVRNGAWSETESASPVTQWSLV
jgi:hypothetical protein